MDLIYREQHTVSFTDCDCFGRLRPSALVTMVQQCGNSQCLQMDLGWDKMAGRGLFWAVIRQRVAITRLPGQGEVITIETWPGTTSRVAYPRSAVAYDAQGNELFRSIGLWVLMDLNTRAMILPGDSGICVTGCVRENELALPRSLSLKNLSGLASRQVTFSELDMNGHMNNARYLDWAADLLPSAFHRDHPLRSFTINYTSEAREAEQLRLQYEMTPDGQLSVEAARPDEDDHAKHHRVFALQAQYV